MPQAHSLRVAQFASLARVAAMLVVCLAFFLACKHSDRSSSHTRSSEPSIVLTDATPNLLLTWVDDQGEFHTTQSISDIKDVNRAQVRVVFADKDPESADQVFVADLRQKRADGSYTVASLTRAAWDELGAKNRKSRMETLAAPVGPVVDAGKPAGDVLAVIYGAPWCGACHQMAQYLKAKGVKYVEKDVDSSNTIQAELQAKLARAHVPPTSSIPVTEINGKIIVGFNPAAVDSALAAPTGTRTL